MKDQGQTVMRTATTTWAAWCKPSETGLSFPLMTFQSKLLKLGERFRVSRAPDGCVMCVLSAPAPGTSFRYRYLV